MTWKEWKESIESQGVRDDTEIGHVMASNDFEPIVEHRGNQAIIKIGTMLLGPLETEGDPNGKALTPE